VNPEQVEAALAHFLRSSSGVLQQSFR
jgi:hypothetical protein